jgi:hypothetical protein
MRQNTAQDEVYGPQIGQLEPLDAGYTHRPEERGDLHGGQLVEQQGEVRVRVDHHADIGTRPFVAAPGASDFAEPDRLPESLTIVEDHDRRIPHIR